MYIGQIIFTAFIVLIIASLDAFALGFSYGTKRIHVPLKSISIVSIICSLFILAALLIGYFIGEVVPEHVTKWLGFGIFMVLGLSRIVVWLVNRKKGRQEVRLITYKELVLLAIVLSIDGMGIGLGAGLGQVTLVFIFSIFAISILTEIIIFKLGKVTGRALANKFPVDLGWVGGVLLVIVAIVGLFV